METMFLTLGLALIGLGFLLLVAELFVPSGGVLVVLGLGGLGVGVAFLFRYDTTVGVWSLVGTALALPVGRRAAVQLWPLHAAGAHGRAGADDDRRRMPFDQELEQLRGRHGKTLSALRPAGMVDFDGRRDRHPDRGHDGRARPVGPLRRRARRQGHRPARR